MVLSMLFAVTYILLQFCSVLVSTSVGNVDASLMSEVIRLRTESLTVCITQSRNVKMHKKENHKIKSMCGTSTWTKTKRLNNWTRRLICSAALCR